MDNNQHSLPQVQEKSINRIETSEAKEISKYNAQTHGILRLSITDYEQEFYSDILNDLLADFEPVGTIENMLVERVALSYLKLYRVQKAETEFMKACLNPADIDLDLSWGKREGGYEPKIKDNHMEKLLNVYSRYETTIENRLYRTLHELERAQRSRKGELVQTVAVDVSHISSFGERGEDE